MFPMASWGLGISEIHLLICVISSYFPLLRFRGSHSHWKDVNFSLQTLENGSMTPICWVVTPFFKGQKETPGSHFFRETHPMAEIPAGSIAGGIYSYPYPVQGSRSEWGWAILGRFGGLFFWVAQNIILSQHHIYVSIHIYADIQYTSIYICHRRGYGITDPTICRFLLASQWGGVGSDGPEVAYIMGCFNLMKFQLPCCP